MKELSIEQKAKRYDEAIEIAKEINNEQCAQPFNVMTKVFPELAVSEDERIRKYLIILLQHFCKGYSVSGLDFPVSYKDMLAWLEKQGEQKPAWSEEDDYCLSTIIAEFSKCVGKSVSKDEWMRCNDFLNSFRDRVQPKQEWNGGDEAHLHSLITHLEQWIERHPNTTGADIQGENVAWLKSLKPQNRWKPSDEQMRVLDLAIRCGINRGTTEETTLVSLFNDLKKLKIKL